ncbi:MAG TPA: glycosyltransferase [Pyrinomonadaceae bacterium]|jgi:glycosyltransferase involved in cell wall biosynthesis
MNEMVQPPAGVSLAVVIPTRNRAELAAAAARSLLGQKDCRLEVFVSDNSSSEEERGRLADFCRSEADPRLVYMRPPRSLAMAEHWDWAVGQALERSDATHLTVHYDRKVSKPGQLGLVTRLAARHPERLITFTLDMVATVPPSAVLYQTPWTGKLYEMKSSRVVELTTRGRVYDMGQAFPVLSNCLTPRRALERIRARFGDVCNSTGPDSCFTYRFCAIEDGYLHFDRPLGIVYASHRSNGATYLKGKTDGDFGDFLKTWGDRSWLEAAPVPGINLGQNMLYHEYELVRRAVGGDGFPPIDLDCYLRDLAAGLKWVEDPRARDALRALLEERGWREEPAEEEPGAAGACPAARRPLRARLAPSNVVASARARVRNRWAVLKGRQGLVLFLADRLGIRPPHIHCFTFESDEQALRYALSYPRRPEPVNPYILALEPSELPAPPDVVAEPARAPVETAGHVP